MADQTTLDPDLAALLAAHALTADGVPFAPPRGTAAGDLAFVAGELQAVRSELKRMRSRSGYQRRQCSTCRGSGVYAMPHDLNAKCEACDGAAYHWVFSDVFAAQLAEQRDAEIACLRADRDRLAAEVAALRANADFEKGLK